MMRRTAMGAGWNVKPAERLQCRQCLHKVHIPRVRLPGE